MSEIVVKKYVVRLAPEERARLEEVIGKGKRPAAMILRARILLKADISDAGEGWSDGRIVKALETSLATVHRTRQRLVEEGLDAALARKPRARPSIPRIFDGENEARLITLACSKPPAGHAKWSLRLLEQKVVELGIVAKASDNTIGRTLKKTFSNRT
jgi:transposase